MADDEAETPPNPQPPGSATPNRGRRRGVSIIDGTAQELGPDPVEPAGWVPPSGEPQSADTVAAVPPDALVETGVPAEPAGEFGPAPAGPGEAASTDHPPSDQPFTTQPPEDQPPAASRPSRLPMLLSVLGVVLVLLLGGLFYALFNPPPNPAVAGQGDAINGLTGRVGALEAKAPPDLKPLADRIAALESRPAPTPAPAPDFKPLEDRIAALEAATTQLRSDFGDLKGKLDQAAAAPPSPAPVPAQPSAAPAAQAPVDLAPLRKQVADLSDGLKAVDGRVTALPKLDLAPLDGRIGGLEGKLAGVTAALAALPRIDLAPVTARLDALGGKTDALEGRLVPLEAALAAPKSDKRATEARQNGSAAEARAAPLAVAGEAILRAIDAGRPFAPAVTALRTLGAGPDALGPLGAVADRGAPTRADLVAQFNDAQRAMVGSAAPAPGGSVLDRMVAGAQSLVKVRPAGSAPEQDPDATVSRIGENINGGDFAGALAAWNGLPPDGKAATQGFAARLKARVDAEGAARAVVADAIGTLGAPGAPAADAAK